MNVNLPINPAGGRAVLLTGPFGAPELELALERPMTVAEVIEIHGLQFRLPTIAVMEGEPVLRGCWAVRVVRPGEVLAFVAVPRGGGGDGGNTGKQIAALLAAVALSIAAPMIGAAVFGAGTIGAAVFSAALLAGGSLLLNTLFQPPQVPEETKENVYSVNAAGNQATPLEPIPALYGRLRYPPRFASRPYSEYAGNDQYLYQLFAATVGTAEIEKIEIGETEAWNSVDGYSDSFSDLEFEIVQPGDDVTLFPANVVTSQEVAGQQVPDPSDVLGPFVVNIAGTEIDRIAVDFAFPGGLWRAKDRGVASNSISLRAQYRKIDNDGAPVGSWTNIFSSSISAATRTPQRMTRAADVAPGRYEVQFLANEAFDDDDGTAVNGCVWTGLRGYLTGFVTPPGCTLLAMKVRASEQLSQFSSSQIRITATRHLPVWDGDEWTLQATRSIAWAAADLLMNSDHSIGLTESQFDLDALAALAATWAGRGDTFNALFDRTWTLAEALRAVLRAGRAQPVRVGGRIGFVRLEPKAIKRATFTPRNVVRGSFQHRLVLFDEEKPDSVAVGFIDETTWQQREVIASLAAIGAEQPQKLEAFGITDHDQAWREGVTEAAVNAYQREFVGFTADWEGKLLVRGDPILVMHPFIEGVETAALAGRAGDVLTIDRDPVQDITGAAYVILRGKDGAEWGPCLVETTNGRELTLDAADRAAVEGDMGSLASILPSARAEPAHVLICDGETRPFNGLLVSAVPNAAGKVEIMAVVDAPEVYLADGTEVMPSPWTPPTLPPAVPLRPVVLGLYAELRPAVAGLELDAMWLPAPGASGGYVAEVSYDGEVTWTPVYAGNANRFTVSVLPQILTLRVAAIGNLQGPWSIREFVAGELPDIRITGNYIFYPINLAALDADIAAWQQRAGQSIRDLREGLQRNSLMVINQASQNRLDRQTLRQELRSEIDDNTAAWTLEVDTLATADAAIVTRVESLEAELGEYATIEALDLLSASVTELDGEVTATATALTTLQGEIGYSGGAATFRMDLTGTPSAGWTASGALQFSVAGETMRSTGIYFEATAALARTILDGDQIVVRAGGTVAAVFKAGTTFIDNARIANLTSDSINVEEIVGSSAFLDNLVVGSAQIDELSVNTIHIVDGAVTTVVYAVEPANSDLNSGENVYVELAFPTYLSGSVILILNGSTVNPGSGNVTARLYRRDNSTSSQTLLRTDDYDGDDGSLQKMDFTYVDIPPAAGYYTYRLRLTSNTAVSGYGYSELRFVGTNASK
ncbi:MAG TPA: host specificity factor TipJ family phage tail protein [Devosiaceae bacterium]|jgi:sulfur carrier protein ThiS|nr:host specificity factor TipJ family phage tail protein [Devosiaceae bacterium]